MAPGDGNVQLSWTVNSPTIAGAEAELALGNARGYDNFNLKIGYPQTPQYDLQLVGTVCNFAPGGFTGRTRIPAMMWTPRWPWRRSWRTRASKG